MASFAPSTSKPKKSPAPALPKPVPARRFSDRWSLILKREVDVKLKADLTPVSRIPKTTTGPVELFRSEKSE